MANGDVEYTFDGNPECPICAALDGTTDSEPIPPPHDNCQCTSEATCPNDHDYHGSSTRYGPHGSCFILDVEVTVTCWDGTEIGMEVPIDFGCVGADQDEGFLDEVADQAGDVAAELEAGCPPCEPPLVS
jgi:hypothetical protein